MFYHKQTKRPLSEYQKLLNQCSGDVAVAEPFLLSKRGELFQRAKKAVHDSGYRFKKGQSRSKRFSGSESPAAETPKRPKLSQEVRKDQIHQVNEQLSCINERISFKEKRVFQATNIKNYKLCDELSEEIMNLKGKRHSLLTTLKEYEKKEKRSKAYAAKATSNYSHSSSSSPVVSDIDDRPNSSSSKTISSYPLFSKTPSIPYTDEELRTFKKRYEEGYDSPIYNDRYNGMAKGKQSNLSDYFTVE